MLLQIHTNFRKSDRETATHDTSLRCPLARVGYPRPRRLLGHLALRCVLACAVLALSVLLVWVMTPWASPPSQIGQNIQ